MSEALVMPMKATATRNDAADMRILAQVEKWMATIREINREQQQNEVKFRA